MAILTAALSLVLGAPLPAAIQDSEAPTAAVVDAAVEEAAKFLLGSQESYENDPPVGRIAPEKFDAWQKRERARLDGLRGKGGAAEWPYEGVYRVGRQSKIPSGYRVGGTSIAAEALLRAGLEGETKKSAEDAAKRALEFVLDSIESDRDMSLGPKKGYDVRGWGHTYAVPFLLVMLDQGLVDGEEEIARVKATIPDLILRIEGNQTSQGGWNYANDRSVSPFMTGSTLLILFDAIEHGYAVKPEVITKALDALEAAGTEEMSYAYSGSARGKVEMPGSSARAAVATLALYKAGRSDIDALRVSVEGFFTGWDDLLQRKSKQGTHEPPYGIAPYYFFFGHTYAAYAIEELGEKERDTRRAELAGLLWRTREDDGTWNDRIFPRTASYSTAMSILALRAPARTGFPGYKADAKRKAD